MGQLYQQRDQIRRTANRRHPTPRGTGILDAGYWKLDAGYWKLDAGYRKLNTTSSSQLPASSIRFWVRDNGIGIPVAQQAQLFTKFTRLRDTEPGHGLGLSIARNIVEKLGGAVGVESEVGQGSTFWFTLPAL
ncbi:MAG TPA: HAMP domain-containing sensor histidine kinase [Anaerolineae bacterium]|nr:HAMP domain-containing sensor histidine kinase [Anaerolineae bacterium]HQI83680.1 HAMP domain-containing sensor histidine kinase [Anaerolineae bacterium]